MLHIEATLRDLRTPVFMPSIRCTRRQSILEGKLPCVPDFVVLHRVQSVEHLLSALEACGVDNARIEIEGGPEVPIIDGSALSWAIDLHAVRLHLLHHEKGCNPKSRFMRCYWLSVC